MGFNQLDCLFEEVFTRQTADVQDFLVRTSILNQLTAELCDAVVERGDSQELLESLERTNLFIVPLDLSREWYRYHRLFKDLLRHKLQMLGVLRKPLFTCGLVSGMRHMDSIQMLCIMHWLQGSGSGPVSCFSAPARRCLSGEKLIMLKIEIRVKGHMDEHWSEWFQDFEILASEENETIMSGEVKDQAALYGLIAKRRDLGVILISVNEVDWLSKKRPIKN